MSFDTCVITTFFNPFNSKYRINNFYLFLENLKKSIDLENFYVLEILNNNQTPKIKDCKSFNITNNSLIWQKESGLNYLVKNIDLSNYKKIITIDCDIFFKNYEWVQKTSELLDRYHLCQPFRSIQYLNFNSTEVDSNIDGVVYSYLVKDTDAQHGNGGLVVGYNKDYVTYMNGFFDKSPVGGGDTFNILPFLYNCKVDLSLFDNLMPDVRVEYFNYLMKARNYIKNKDDKKYCFFADYIVHHLFHGSLSKRQYNTRYNYINKNNYYDNFEKDNNGMIELKKDSNLKIPIEEYFLKRQEIIDLDQPIIWCDVKYNIEQINDSKFMWLSDKNKFIFNNIIAAKIKFDNPQKITNVILYNNDSLQSVNFDFDKAEVNINNPQKIEIFADHFIPESIGRNSDTRRLSIMLNSIEIITKNSVGKYIEYPLENLL